MLFLANITHLTYCISAWAEFLNISCKTFSLSRKDAFVYFSEKCVIMIILSFTRPVQASEVLMNIGHLKITALRTLNQFSKKKSFIKQPLLVCSYQLEG